MQTIFPNATGYQGFFLVGYRKNPANTTHIQRTGTVLLKRTYTITPSNTEPETGAVLPTTALPVFVQDQFTSDGSMLLYEYDLESYKPEGDVVVLGFVGGTGTVSVQVHNQVWLRRTLAAGDTHLFGWHLRSDEPRRSEGAFPLDDAQYPLPNPLPSDFNNRYYNGYRRGVNLLNPVPYVPVGVPVLIERSDTRYGFRLGSEVVTARYSYYPGTGPDDDCRWRHQTVPMPLDTLVIEPDANRCYAVWRGVWDFDERQTGDYRRLLVSAT
jgi:hypothetical protein